MKAIQFDATIPRYVTGKTLGRISPALFWSGISCTYAKDVPPPDLPTPDWVRVRTSLGGICGTDMGTIMLHTSTYYSPFSSGPFTIGHENVVTIQELGPETPADWQVGERVVVEPLLWCKPRGFTEYCEFCARGEINRCQRITQGTVAAGVMTGVCKDTGGSWSESFIAHPSQLHRVPENVSDENALMIEPFAIGIHAALISWPRNDETVLILGAGTIGLTTLAALRALGSEARILVLARYDFQVEAARRLGATEILNTRSGDCYEWVAEKTGGKCLHPILGRRVVSGGADLTIECVGSDVAIDQAMRFTKDGGRVVLAGLPGIAKGVDWTAIFAQELRVIASRNYNNIEPWNGRKWEATELALHLMETGRVDLGWMVTHRYSLDNYKLALREASLRGETGMIKGVFEFPG